MKYLSEEDERQINSLIKGTLAETVEKLIDIRKEYGGLGIFPNFAVTDSFHLDGEDMEIRVSVSLEPFEEEFDESS